MRQSVPLVRLGILLLGTLGACAETTGPQPQGSTLSSPSPDTTIRGLDSVYLAIEAQVPGFAGVYARPDSAYVLLLTDPSDSARAKQVVADYLHTQSGQGPTPTFVIAPARYRFSQLLEWQRAVATLMSDPETASLDADEVLNAVHLFVTPGSDIAQWQTRVEALGVPADAIVVTYGETPVAQPGT
ncbi:MAG TPA: hypothetical protein VFN83_09105 [Gemmatimonadales bacterium]|jgi:hypothetical protein|nr:hypothetical protein [Gemmatimonadales bacterium]